MGPDVVGVGDLRQIAADGMVHLDHVDAFRRPRIQLIGRIAVVHADPVGPALLRRRRFHLAAPERARGGHRHAGGECAFHEAAPADGPSRGSFGQRSQQRVARIIRHSELLPFLSLSSSQMVHPKADVLMRQPLTPA